MQGTRVAIFASLLAVASAVAAVSTPRVQATPIADDAIKVYGNGFGSVGQMKQLMRVRRSGNPACGRSFSSSGRMKVVIGGKIDGVSTTECAYDPLVVGGPLDGGDVAGSSPGQGIDNLEVDVVGRISSGSPAGRVERAFQSISLRDGNDGDIAHHLAVFPATRHWEVWRRGPGQSQCSIVAQGDGGPVAGLSAPNALALRAFRGPGGANVDLRASINGQTVHSAITDPGFTINPGRAAATLGTSTPVPGEGDRAGAACANANDGGGKDVSGSFDDMHVHTTYNVPEDGKMVGFRLKLSEPNTTQQAFFDDFTGGRPRATVGVLDKVEPYSNRFSLERKFPGVDLAGFLGRRVTVVPGAWLDASAGSDKAALIVPTWAPLFRVGLSDANTWRSTREEGFNPPDSSSAGEPPGCGAQEMRNGHAHTIAPSTARYVCNYDTARLLYTALIAPSTD